MSSREIIALGTSSQVPTRYRNHNGYLLRWDEHGLLFDPGEGTQRQMIYAEVTVTQVTKILVTHFHGDHCLGLAGISQRISLDRVPHEIQVHFPRSGRKYYDRLRKASIYHDVSRLRPCPIEGPGVIDEGPKLSLRAARLDHAVETYGYRLQERDGRTMLPDKLAAAGVRGPAIKRLIQEGELEVDGRVVRLEDVSVPKPGQSFAFQEMVDFLLEKQIAKYKLPERLEVRGELPTVGDSGKINKEDLKKDIAALLQAEKG